MIYRSALAVLATAAISVAGCAEAVSSSDAEHAEGGSSRDAPRANKTWRAPTNSGTATGTAAGDAGRDRLEIPKLPEVASIKSGPPPRSRDEIFAERIRLKRLYITGTTSKRVIAPISRGNHVDDATGEICWPALGCYNPDCPERGANGEHYAFVAVDPLVYVASDGTFKRRSANPKPQANVADTSSAGEMFARDPSLLGNVCPACLKVRDLANETDADRRQYETWIRPHELPETAKRLRELNEERQRRIVWERANR